MPPDQIVEVCFRLVVEALNRLANRRVNSLVPFIFDLLPPDCAAALDFGWIVAPNVMPKFPEQAFFQISVAVKDEGLRPPAPVLVEQAFLFIIELVTCEADLVHRFPQILQDIWKQF